MLVKQQHIDAFNADGAVMIKNAFSANWTDKLSSAIYRVLHEADRPDFPRVKPDGEPVPPAFIKRTEDAVMAMNILPYAEEVEDWRWNSPAAEITGQLMGGDYARHWSDTTFLKEGSAESAATPWHNDECSWPMWGKQMAILWIALTDVDEDNAPLMSVRGSHKGHTRYHAPMYADRVDTTGLYRPWQELLDRANSPGADVQTWTMSTGDCLVMRPGVIHCSRPRRKPGGGRRLAFSTRWLGDDVIFAPDQMSERLHQFNPGLKPGGPPGDDILPIQWRREGGLQPMTVAA